MDDSLTEILLQRIRRVHDSILKLAEELSEEQLAWRPRRVRTAPTIKFHLWHISRWADRIQSSIANMTDELQKRLGTRHQLWVTEGLAIRWGLDPVVLGVAETGMGMDDTTSSSLRLPSKDILLPYARRAFASLDEAMSAIDDQQFLKECLDFNDRPSRVGIAVLNHFQHANRHLGMIEALRGVLGMRGSASA